MAPLGRLNLLVGWRGILKDDTGKVPDLEPVIAVGFLLLLEKRPRLLDGFVVRKARNSLHTGDVAFSHEIAAHARPHGKLITGKKYEIFEGSANKLCVRQSLSTGRPRPLFKLAHRGCSLPI
jgi:hypothetical protein